MKKSDITNGVKNTKLDEISWFKLNVNQTNKIVLTIFVSHTHV